MSRFLSLVEIYSWFEDDLPPHKEGTFLQSLSVIGCKPTGSPFFNQARLLVWNIQTTLVWLNNIKLEAKYPAQHKALIKRATCSRCWWCCIIMSVGVTWAHNPDKADKMMSISLSLAPKTQIKFSRQFI